MFSVLTGPRRLAGCAVVLAALATACGDDASEPVTTGAAQATGAPGVESTCFADPGIEPIDPSAADPESLAGTELTLVAYDSFLVSDGVFEAFEEETGIQVSVLTSADTGTMVSEAILTAGNPVADVMWGIDNTFLCRALEAGVFVPYESARLDVVPAELRLDPHHRVTPVDVSDMCVNYWIDELDGPPPESMAELAEPEYATEFVTENPETSAPGMGFLLSTIAAFGDGGWQDYWQRLAENGVKVTPGWTEAYYGDFIAGGGDRAIVMSYASSPVAELVFADPPVDSPPTASLADSCFRSIEFAGVLAGTEHPEAAALLVDFLLSPTVQEDIPLNMFVFPASSQAELPPEFEQWAPLVEEPLTVPPEVIEANRDAWTERWTEIVLR